MKKILQFTRLSRTIYGAILFAGLGLFLLPGEVSAATYYVDTTGNDSYTSAQAQSSSTPWRTISKTAGIAVSGDTVNIQSGTYTETVNINKYGAAGAEITFNGSGSPIIRGNVALAGSYNILNGVTISPPTGSFGGNAVSLGGQHNTLKNCLVTNYGACAGNQATAISLGGAYNTVEGCTVRDMNDIDVFHVFGHDQVIRNTYVTNINGVYESPSNPAPCGGYNHTDFFQTWGWPGSYCYNILVEGCTVTNSNCQLGNTEIAGGWPSGPSTGLHDITFRNNIFANIGASFFNGVPNTVWYNNVFYNSGTGGNGWTVILYNITDAYNSDGAQFKNNAFYAASTDIAKNIVNGEPGITIDHNYFGGAGGAAKFNGEDMGSNFINGGDPKFVSLTGLDFHVQSGSVLIDKGADLSSLFTTDKNGNTRSGAWDIGCYEYGSTQVSSVPVEPITFDLSQNYPNPFNPMTSIKYQIPKSSFVKISVYNILGVEVRTLVNEEQSVGSYEVKLDANGLSSGVYFYKIQAGEFVQSKKMLLTK